MRTANQFIEELADREAIRECVFLYSRAIDRRDEALLRTVYWPDAHNDYGFFECGVDEFVTHVFAALATMQQSMHSLTNILINIALPHAQVETYFVAYHHMTGETGAIVDMTMGGRYLDRMEKRAGEWRIARRDAVIDWMTEAPASGDWAARLPGVDKQSNIAPHDKSCALFAGTRFGN